MAWEVRSGIDERLFVVDTKREGAVVCRLAEDSDLDTARIIAAAPEMFEVSKMLLQWAETHPKRCTFSGVTILKTAVDKAKGIPSKPKVELETEITKPDLISCNRCPSLKVRKNADIATTYFCTAVKDESGCARGIGQWENPLYALRLEAAENNKRLMGILQEAPEWCSRKSKGVSDAENAKAI